ncbi:MAG TPA: metallophosphoesterase, partial [Verrucomicrobiae bacterium]|nr:metallophosphoesterase [Verrucomicrobiae bacterium]
MEKPAEKLKIAAVGDLHVQEIPQQYYSELFERISDEADILLICGDMTNLGLPSEAKSLVQDLQHCKIPVLALLGNHDHHSGHVDEIKKIFMDAKVTFLDHESYVLKGVGFAGVKGFCGGFENYMLGPFGEDATKHFVTEAINQSLRLENSLKQLNVDKIVVGLHYSPIVTTVVGEPLEIYPFLGSSRLEETIDRFE